MMRAVRLPFVEAHVGTGKPLRFITRNRRDVEPPPLIDGINGSKLITGDHILIKERPEKSWDYPGGKIDVGETPLEALHRELFEETGMHLSNVVFLGVSDAPGARTYMFTADEISFPNHVQPRQYEVGMSGAAEWVPRIYGDVLDAFALEVGLPVTYEGFDVLYGSGAETRSLSIVEGIMRRNNFMILVDDARISDLNLFPHPPSSFGIHAVVGTRGDGVTPFDARVMHPGEHWAIDVNSNRIIYLHPPGSKYNVFYIDSLKTREPVGPFGGLTVEVFPTGQTFMQRGPVYYAPYSSEHLVHYYVGEPPASVVPSLIDRWAAYRGSVDVDKEQARRLATVLFVKRDMLTYRPSKTGYPVSLFAISNARNERRRVMQFITSMPRFIGLFPSVHYARMMTPTPEHMVVGGKLLTNLPGGSFQDELYSPSEFLGLGCQVMSVLDYYCRVMWDGAPVPIDKSSFDDPERQWTGLPSASWDPAHPLTRLWFVVVKTGPAMDSVLNSTTFYVKSISIPMRLAYGHTNSTLHEFRWRALYRRFPAAEKGDDPVTGVVDGYRIGIAGHVVNVLLAQHIWVIDVRDRLDAVALNLEATYGKMDKWWRATYQMSLEGEPGTVPNQMWHSYIEMDLAVDAYLLIANALGWEPDVLSVSYFRKRLVELKRKYPAFNTQESHFVKRWTA
jgi:8-oxo-dGTP pyrophosphatase MutT (NUDIX family)